MYILLIASSSTVAAIVQRWRNYASLAYPATAMRCLAAWAVGGMTVAAGLLPDPDSAVASVAVASNLYVSTYPVLLQQTLPRPPMSR